jgi:hypothetical protein
MLSAQCETHQELFDTVQAGIQAKDPYLIAKTHHPEYRSWYGEEASGTEEMVRGLKETYAGIPDYHCEIEDVICTEDRMVFRWTITGTLLEENTPIKGRGISIMRIQDDLVIEEWEVQELME